MKSEYRNEPDISVSQGLKFCKSGVANRGAMRYCYLLEQVILSFSNSHVFVVEIIF